VVQFWAPFVLVGLAAVFIGQNRDRQQVRFLWLTVESPMWLLLAAMLLVGVAVGLLLRRRRR
jgi:LPXTG-motif cell wall-anchored protein